MTFVRGSRRTKEDLTACSEPSLPRARAHPCLGSYNIIYGKTFEAELNTGEENTTARDGT